MKKLFTVLLAMGLVSVSFAQSRDSRYPQDSKSVILGRSGNGSYDKDDRRYDNDRYDRDDRSRTAGAEKNAQLYRINREFDARINAVRNNRRLRSSEKSRQVRSLEAQRREEISRTNARFDQWRNGNSNDRYSRNSPY
ncbi:MAG: hypothetical protein JWP69_1365 [Flaviaesturariibacter sp.]|nr:hypothetical protein [Flaviaesturariibacter sp.]